MIYLKFEQMECNLTQIVAQIEITWWMWMKTKVKVLIICVNDVHAQCSVVCCLVFQLCFGSLF